MSQPQDPWARPAGSEPTTPAYPPSYGVPSQPAGGYGSQSPYGNQAPYGNQSPYGNQAPYGGSQSPYGGQMPAQSPYGGQSPYGAPSPYPTPFAYQPPKKSAGARVAIAVVIVIAVVAGIFVVTKVAGSHSSANGGASTSSANLPIPLGSGAKLLDATLAPPTGAKPQPLKNSTNGVMTLDQFIANFFDGDSTEKSRLTDRGYAVAVQRDWVDADGVETDLQLVQFNTVDGAHRHLTGQEGAYNSDTTFTGSYDIAGVKGGRGYEQSDPDKYGNRRATLIAQDRNVVIVVFIFTPHSFDRAAESSIVSRQVAALDKLG